MNSVTFAMRQAWRRPAFSAVVVLMIALGIGINVGMFSLFYDVLIRPLPVRNPDELVNLGAPGPKPGSSSCGSAGTCESVFSYPMFRDLESDQQAFAGLAGHRDFAANLSLDGDAIAGTGMLVSGRYFEVLGLKPALGRLLRPEDEPAIGESAVAVLSHDYWRDQFGADSEIVGRSLTVNGVPLTIVGVAPPGFSGTTFGVRPQVFIPLTLRWQMERDRRPEYEDRRAYWVYVFARLKTGGRVENARAQINVLYRGILNEIEAPINAGVPEDVLSKFRNREITIEPGALGQSQLAKRAELPLRLLLGASIVVILIVGVNLTVLLLVRGAAREREIAIRASLGGRRRELITHLSAEGSLYAVVGILLSVPISWIAVSVVLAMLPTQMSSGIAIGLNPAAMATAGAASLLPLVTFGLMAAMRMTRAEPHGLLMHQSARSTGGRSAAAFRRGLIIAQIALSTALLMLAGLFAESMLNIARIDLGMNVSSLVTFRVAPSLNGYNRTRVNEIFNRIEENLAARNGVTSVASSMVPLIGRFSWDAPLSVQGFEVTAGADVRAALNWVGPSFFTTLAIPMLSGRGFTDADLPDSPRVAVVNRSFVEKFNLGPDAVGRHFGIGEGSAPTIEIVGVVDDSKYSEVKGDTPPQFFRPRRQNDSLGALSFYLRTERDTDSSFAMIRSVVADIDPRLPVSSLMTMDTQIRNNVFFDRLMAIMSMSFAALATALAAIGLYGVLAYSVAARTREFGVRLAFGATARRLRFIVLKEVGLVSVAGLISGAFAAISVATIAESMLVDVSVSQPSALGFAVAVLSIVTLTAAYVPVRRASRAAPMEALRQE